jgi:hypothetical protein
MRRYRNMGIMGPTGERPLKPKRPKTAKEAEMEYLGSVEEAEASEKKIDRKPGRVFAIRPDEQIITTTEANHFLAVKYEELSKLFEEAIQDRDEAAGLPASVREKVFREKVSLIEAEGKRLELLSMEVNDALMSKEAREAVYEGAEVMVENPYFNAQVEKLAEVEAGLDTWPDVDGKRRELTELQLTWRELTKQTDRVMANLKVTSAWGGARKRFSEAAAMKLEQPIHYPQILEADVEKANARAEFLRDAKAFEEATHAEKRERGYADQLQYLLTALDDINEAIQAKTREVEFLEKMYMPDAIDVDLSEFEPPKKKSAKTILETVDREIKTVTWKKNGRSASAGRRAA